MRYTVMGKKNRVNLSCTVPKEIKDELSKIADYEEQTVSRLAAKAIKIYIKKLKEEGHPSIQ